MAKKKQSPLARIHELQDQMFDLMKKVASGEVDPKEADRRAKAANRELRGLKPKKRS